MLPPARMRTVLALALLGACSALVAVRPGVTPRLSELPTDREKRDALLDSANTQPTAEKKKPLPPKQRKLETIAATAAAVVGSMFSKTQNVSIGALGTLEEVPTKKQPRRATEEKE